MEKENKEVIKIDLTIDPSQLEIVNEKKDRGFKALTADEQIKVINRIIETRRSINQFNTGIETEFYVSIYGDSKKKFQKGDRYQLDGHVVTLQQATVTGSNLEVQLNNCTLKISGASFVTEDGTKKVATFAQLTAIPKPKKDE